MTTTGLKNNLLDKRISFYSSKDLLLLQNPVIETSSREKNNKEAEEAKKKKDNKTETQKKMIINPKKQRQVAQVAHRSIKSLVLFIIVLLFSMCMKEDKFYISSDNLISAINSNSPTDSIIKLMFEGSFNKERMLIYDQAIKAIRSECMNKMEVTDVKFDSADSSVINIVTNCRTFTAKINTKSYKFISIIPMHSENVIKGWW